MDNKSVILPKWIDKIIFDDFEAESELEIQDVINMSNVQYHFIMSFKAINEFVQRGTFNKSNPYELIVSYFSPLLKANGVFIISDVTTKVDNGLYYPQMMNSCLLYTSDAADE